MRFYQHGKIFHFAMIGGILNFISFFVDSMRSVLNEKLYFALKDSTSSHQGNIIIMINNCLKPYSPLTFQAESYQQR